MYLDITLANGAVYEGQALSLSEAQDIANELDSLGHRTEIVEQDVDGYVVEIIDGGRT